MSEKVVSLFGGVVPAISTGDETVVGMLRRLLSKAEAGEIIGVGYVAVFRDLACTFERGGTLGSYSSVGAAEALKLDLLKIAMGDDE